MASEPFRKYQVSSDESWFLVSGFSGYCFSFVFVGQEPYFGNSWQNSRIGSLALASHAVIVDVSPGNGDTVETVARLMETGALEAPKRLKPLGYGKRFPISRYTDYSL